MGKTSQTVSPARWYRADWQHVPGTSCGVTENPPGAVHCSATVMLPGLECGTLNSKGLLLR